jgi:hypothetical protein
VTRWSVTRSVIPTAAEGPLLAGAFLLVLASQSEILNFQLEISFHRFSDSATNSNPSHPSAEGRVKSKATRKETNRI